VIVSSLLIKASDVTLAYKGGERVVMEGVDFEVNQGEFIFITGQSGSGKSTLLKSLYGALRPHAGSLVVKGYEMAELTKTELQKLRLELGIVFQDYRLVNEWTVEQNIVLPLELEGYPKDTQKEQAKKLLKHVQLEDSADAYPLELSGGEQQRVGIARALSKTPQIILADEPTGNLDEYSSNLIWQLLEKSCKMLNSTVLVVTHKMPETLTIPYRHFTIEKGKFYEVS